VGRIIHLELTADDLDLVSRFYIDAFGWRTEVSPYADGYLLAETGSGDGIDAAVMLRSYKTQPAIAWIQVDDLDAARAAVVKAGGAVEGEIQEIPGQGRLSYVRDPEGTLLGLRE
jgi:predicted enzyme related to lactoylglutathione lyase